MSEVRDPIWEQIAATDNVRTVIPFASSAPFSERQGVPRLWRRVAEGADGVDEFSEALIALGAFRSFGFHTPPYAATLEAYEGWPQNCVMYVAHVDARSYDQLDFTNKSIADAYIATGHRLMDYYPYCRKQGVNYLTDMCKLDQFIYTADGELTMVDLELHNSSWAYDDQIRYFRSKFIRPLERRVGPLPDLRAHARSTMKLAKLAAATS